MKRIVASAVIAGVLMLAMACAQDPVEAYGTNNQKVPVALLFEHEGCRIYRFKDGGEYRYYAVCRDAISTSMTDHHQHGKVRYSADFPTVTAP